MEDLKTLNKLDETELKQLQDLNGEFHKFKLALGELELKKAELLRGVDNIKTLFEVEERKLIEKYGPDSVINLKTGQITQKENG